MASHILKPEQSRMICWLVQFHYNSPRFQKMSLVGASEFFLQRVIQLVIKDDRIFIKKYLHSFTKLIGWH